MKKNIITLLFLIVCIGVEAQKDRVLFSINKQPVYVSEFKKVYEKNLNLVKDTSAKDIDNYLELFVNYKLKVKEAYTLKLDTLPPYKKELAMYKKQLLAPYLQDEAFIKSMVKKAYNRTVNEVKASHILVKIPKKATVQDTLKAYAKITEARKRILEGVPFKVVAKEVSEDPSAKFNAGNLGYFKAFKMVYPFEEAAYTTPVGGVSKPFRTRFGYHIVKVFATRKSKGEFEVAHVLLKGDTPENEQKITKYYKQIKNKQKTFESIAKAFSQDRGSANRGGKLPKFGTGEMVSSFEKAVLDLDTEGEVSKPFKTKFGWHIVTLLKKHPVASFETLKPVLNKRIRNSSRMQLSDKKMLNNLKKKYRITENKKLIEKELLSSNATKVLLTINKKEILQKKYTNYLAKNRKRKNAVSLFEKFKNKEILEYFKEDLLASNTEFKAIFTEYKEGLLLFELMQQKIWNKASKDTLGLKNFYAKNKIKYSKKLKTIKGQVINDYQKEIEDNWIESLRKKNKIVIRKRTLRKLKKHYNKN